MSTPPLRTDFILETANHFVNISVSPRQLTGALFIFILEIIWWLVRQQLLLDTLGQMITGDKAAETGFPSESIQSAISRSSFRFDSFSRRTSYLWDRSIFLSRYALSGMLSRTCSRELPYNHAS